MKMQKHISLALICAIGVLASLEFGRGSVVGGYSHGNCIESEKQALMLFKKTMIDNSSYLSSWVGDDCCAWHGITCNNVTNHVTRLELQNGDLSGKILPSLLDLKYLTHLDLSCNSFGGNRIPEFFGSFKDLRYLNLSSSSFEGLIPRHLGNLSNLQYLDLSYYAYSRGLQLRMDSMGWLSKFSSLKHLDLSGVNLSSAIDWFSSINMLSKSILVLDLSDCHLPNNIPRRLPSINLTSLVSFYLGSNHLNSSFPSWVLNNSNLAHLSLRYNNFDGPIPESIGSLSSLSFLSLGDNNFDGPIPESIGSLSSLSFLSLPGNKFQDLIPRSIGNLTSLSTLDLSFNELSDSISPEMGNLTKLTDLSMGSNGLWGSLPETLCQLSKLEMLDVEYNQLTGNIPKCIGRLSNLIGLFLEGNSWEGFVSEDHFINLKRLVSLSISSDSNLNLTMSSEWVPPFQLVVLYMYSFQIGPKFPHWLLTQTKIEALVLSNTSISDTFPIDWFSSLLLIPFSFFDLSNNDFNGEQLSLISRAPNDLAVLILSDNRFSGEFPAFLCNQTSLVTLDLSNNNFYGELPRCLENLTELRNLDLMNNDLSGKIPSLGSLRNLQYLNLYNNKFQGKLPSFQNLTELFGLDVGKNNLSDVLPNWTGEQLPKLKYLKLQSNNFYGEIPEQLCQLSSIEVLNLADNQITGNIPACFGNFSAMVTGNITSNILYTWGGVQMIDETRGYEQNYTSTLQFLFSIDLSNNNIGGEIPKELMDLHGLLHLNLAGNHLAGKIPNEIGKLENLIFLDLSRNELYGRIPQSLSNLNFLSQLNLSFNDLSGRVPTGYQLQTLNDPSIYAGNDQLCDQAILKPCTGDRDTQNVNNYNKAENDYDSDDELMWFFVGLGPGLPVGFWGCFAFFKYWRFLTIVVVNKFLTKLRLPLLH